jgi:hypothetical protein
MRKIEQNVIDAIRGRRNFCGGNTVVSMDKDGQGFGVSLHGHIVARLEGSTLHLDWCGWDTPTTRSRLNCVLKALRIMGIIACIRGSSGIFLVGVARIVSGALTLENVDWTTKPKQETGK